MCVKHRIKIIFCFVKQISNKERVGTTYGYIFNPKGKHLSTQAPQESPEGAWLVTLIDVSEEERKGFTIVKKEYWTPDSSLKISIIEW